MIKIRTDKTKDSKNISRMALVFCLIASLSLALLSFGLMARTALADDSWTQMTSGTSQTLWGIWGNSASDVFALGSNGTILHYDGNSWNPMESPVIPTISGGDHYQDAWGSSSSDVFAVGDDGTIIHYDGGNWTEMESGTNFQLNGIWGSSASDIFAIGHAGTILHYNDSNWNSMSSPATTVLHDVWGSSSSDVFVVGVGGYIFHYDGNTWSQMTSVTSNRLFSVWGNSPSDIYAVGQYGTILHYNGSSWSQMTSGTSYYLHGIWGSSPSDIYAVGSWDSILHYDGSSWSQMTIGTSCHLQGIWGSSSDVFAVGYDGIILHCSIQPNQVPAQIDFNPDTLNLKSKGKRVTTYIELPEGYDIDQVDISSIMLNDTVPAEAKPTKVGDYDNDGVPDLMVRFDGSLVRDILTAGDEIEITIAGEVAGVGFEGSDTIRVINK
ncbi:WD40/YVTN/BNR-like repeat-containing protein [Chloroflexota bacterium]